MKVPVPVYSKKIQNGLRSLAGELSRSLAGDGAGVIGLAGDGASMLADEISRTNKISYTKSIQIAFVINPNWIQGKWEGSYRDHCTSMHMHDCSMQRKEFTKCRQARPDFAALSPADRCRPVDGLRTYTDS